MALPNPDLTHIQTDLVNAASTSPADVTAAIKAAINALTGAQAWTAVDAATADATNNPGLLISAPAGGTIPNFRALFGYADTGTAKPAAGALDGDTDTSITDGVAYVGFGPGVSNITTENWYDSSPLGAGVRFSKLTRALPALIVTKVWAVASAESLWIWCRGADDAKIHMFGVGALIQPWALSGDAESDERLYALSSLGSANSMFVATAHTWGATGGIFSGSTSANNTEPRNRVMLPGVSTMANWRWRHLEATAGMATGTDTYRTISGRPVLHWGSMEAIRTDGGVNYGRLRGVAPYGDEISRRILRNSGADKAIIISGHMSSPQDSFAFRAG